MDRYVRADFLGKGTLRTVYKAIDRKEGIEVAWHEVEIHGTGKVNQDIVQKVKNNKHVVKFITSWHDHNNKYIYITELMTSGTLRKFLCEAERVSIKVIKDWCRQILKGLKYLHTLNQPIIHRDIKLENIYLRGTKGKVKIGDLGMATIMKQKDVVRSRKGTPAFMAPELYKEKYDEKVDIWAFGLCVIEMVTLEYPYKECRNNESLLHDTIAAGILPRALARIKDYGVFEFICCCLEIDPKKRLSAKELLKHPFIRITDHKKNINYVELAIDEEFNEIIASIPQTREGWENFIWKTIGEAKRNESSDYSSERDSRSSEEESDEEANVSSDGVEENESSIISLASVNDNDESIKTKEYLSMTSSSSRNSLNSSKDESRPTVYCSKIEELSDDELIDDSVIDHIIKHPPPANNLLETKSASDTLSNHSTLSSSHDVILKENQNIYSPVTDIDLAPTANVPVIIDSKDNTTTTVIFIDNFTDLPSEDIIPSNNNKSLQSIELELILCQRLTQLSRRFRFKYDITMDTPQSTTNEIIRYLKLSPDLLQPIINFINSQLLKISGNSPTPSSKHLISHSRNPIQRCSTAPTQPPSRLSPDTSLGQPQISTSFQSINESEQEIVQTQESKVELVQSNTASIASSTSSSRGESPLKRACSSEEMILKKRYQSGKLEALQQKNLLELTFTSTNSKNSTPSNIVSNSNPLVGHIPTVGNISSSPVTNTFSIKSPLSSSWSPGLSDVPLQGVQHSSNWGVNEVHHTAINTNPHMAYNGVGSALNSQSTLDR